MKQHTFEKKYHAEWDTFAALTAELETPPKGEKSTQCGTFPMRYRKLCHHYTLAKKRCYTPAVTSRLHDLVLRGYRQIHRPKKAVLAAVFFFFWFSFPHRLRKSFGYFLLSLFLFLAPAVTAGFLCYSNPLALQRILPAQQVAEAEDMYNPIIRKGNRSITRSAEQDFLMFGFYIRHNASLGLRTFTGGLLLGAGAVLALIYNGMTLGGVSGHLSHQPFAETFWSFVAGHSSWELTAIVISGAAGLLLGKSILCPGKYSRKDALRSIAPQALQLAMGAAVMFVLAAFIEAFWSASLVSPTVKYLFSLANWGVVILYLSLSGRAHGTQ